jgi:hypothetical protein
LSGAESSQQRVAGVLAVTAGDGADPAVLHVIRMALAFLAADPAGCNTGCQLEADHFLLDGCLA